MTKIINLASEAEASDGEGLTIEIGPATRIDMKTGVTSDCIRVEVSRNRLASSGRRGKSKVFLRLMTNDGEGYPELLETLVKLWRYGDVPVS